MTNQEHIELQRRRIDAAIDQTQRIQAILQDIDDEAVYQTAMLCEESSVSALESICENIATAHLLAGATIADLHAVRLGLIAPQKDEKTS